MIPLLRSLLKHLIKYFDDFIKHLDDFIKHLDDSPFVFVQLLIKGIKENWEAILLVVLSVFLICIFYNRNKANKK